MSNRIPCQATLTAGTLLSVLLGGCQVAIPEPLPAEPPPAGPVPAELAQVAKPGGVRLPKAPSALRVAPDLQGVVVSHRTGDPVRTETPVVVYARPLEPGPRRAVGDIAIRQAHGAHEPSFFVVPVGHEVRFENGDRLCHRYFSTSKHNVFKTEILQPRESGRVRFAQPGLVQVYCSLHEGKQATILVIPSAYFAIIRQNGKFEISNIPTGRYSLETWYRGRILRRDTIDVVEGGLPTVQVTVPDVGETGT